jgi:hypothetical protein
MVKAEPEVLGMNQSRAVQLQELRSRIDKGLSEAVRGKVSDGDAFMQGLLEDLNVKDSRCKAGAVTSSPRRRKGI